MATHVIKFTHRDGKKLYPAEAWCGRDVQGVAFQDAQHLALRNESGSVWGHPPCKSCIKAIVKALGTGDE